MYAVNVHLQVQTWLDYLWYRTPVSCWLHHCHKCCSIHQANTLFLLPVNYYCPKDDWLLAVLLIQGLLPSNLAFPLPWFSHLFFKMLHVSIIQHLRIDNFEQSIFFHRRNKVNRQNLVFFWSFKKPTFCVVSNSIRTTPK